jgi:proteasome accessory factor B
LAGATPSPAAKTERLLNLVIALLWTRRPLTKTQIRDAVPQYQQTASLEAFDRMFERDKDELRDLGIPLSTQILDAFFDDELGYRIDRREYALPSIELAPDEVAALALAGRAWSQASLAGAASMALNKLRAAGVEIDDRSVVGLEPSIRTVEPAFDAVRAAVVARQGIAFEYRKPDGSSARRSIHPWGLTSWRGRWYVTGFDVDRGAERVFRLSRIVGPVTTIGKPGGYDVPAGHEPRVLVAGSAEEAARATVAATVRVRDGAGHTLRRRGLVSPGAGDGWAEVVVETADLDRLADEVAGFGPDAVALDPPPLVEGVIRRLRGAAVAHGSSEDVVGR